MTERQLTEAQGRRSGGVAQSGDIKLKLSRFCVLARLRVQCSANPAASTHTQTQELPLAQTSPLPTPLSAYAPALALCGIIYEQHDDVTL